MVESGREGHKTRNQDNEAINDGMSIMNGANQVKDFSSLYTPKLRDILRKILIKINNFVFKIIQY